MPDNNADPVARLASALDRIAVQVGAPDPVAADVAARLDSLIAQLRDALET